MSNHYPECDAFSAPVQRKSGKALKEVVHVCVCSALHAQEMRHEAEKALLRSDNQTLQNRIAARDADLSAIRKIIGGTATVTGVGGGGGSGIVFGIGT